MSDSEEEYSEGSEVDDGGYKVRGVLKAYRVTHYAPPSLFGASYLSSTNLE